MARGHSTVRYLKLEYSVLDPLPLSRLSILTLPTAATRPWIVSGKRLDENGSTCRSPDHLTPITSESPNVFAAVPRCQVTKISPTPLGNKTDLSHPFYTTDTYVQSASCVRSTHTFGDLDVPCGLTHACATCLLTRASPTHDTMDLVNFDDLGRLSVISTGQY